MPAPQSSYLHCRLVEEGRIQDAEAEKHRVEQVTTYLPRKNVTNMPTTAIASQTNSSLLYERWSHSQTISLNSGPGNEIT